METLAGVSQPSAFAFVIERNNPNLGRKTQKHDHSLFIVKFLGWLCIQNPLGIGQEFVLQNTGGIFSFEQEELGVSV